MKKNLTYNDLFQDIEASRFLKENGKPLVRISWTESQTDKGPQITMRLATRITSGDDKGYIETSDSIWPRAYATSQDLKRLRAGVVKNLMLRFGIKTEKKVTEDGEEVEVESWGKPKWVAWFDGTDWHELTGAKVPGPYDAVESTPSDDDDDDDDAEGTDAEQEEEEEA